jgi:hypothetical protein
MFSFFADEVVLIEGSIAEHLLVAAYGYKGRMARLETQIALSELVRRLENYRNMILYLDYRIGINKLYMD